MFATKPKEKNIYASNQIYRMMLQFNIRTTQYIYLIACCFVIWKARFVVAFDALRVTLEFKLVHTIYIPKAFCICAAGISGI